MMQLRPTRRRHRCDQFWDQKNATASIRAALVECSRGRQEPWHGYNSDLNGSGAPRIEATHPLSGYCSVVSTIICLVFNHDGTTGPTNQNRLLCSTACEAGLKLAPEDATLKEGLKKARLDITALRIKMVSLQLKETSGGTTAEAFDLEPELAGKRHQLHTFKVYFWVYFLISSS